MNIRAIDSRYTISVGAPSFLFAFYSTIVCNIPDCQKKYRVLMELLQRGQLSANQCSTCENELEQLRKELKVLPPDLVVWDMNDRKKSPPWGDNISSHISSLGNYFVTADGKDLFDELIALMKCATLHQSDVEFEK